MYIETLKFAHIANQMTNIKFQLNAEFYIFFKPIVI